MEGPSQRKRFRFSYDEPETTDDSRREKKPRFPKGKKEIQKFEREFFEGEEDIGPIKSTDPRVAATERAGRRTGAVDNVEETDIPDDIYGAEEDYQPDEQEGGEISIEPFNLKQEREEGYFDAEGNYVEYRNDNDAKDAWLETAVVDTTLAAKHMKQYEKDEVEKSLSSKEIAVIKRRIADALQPGETVLRALRRLKSSSTEKDKNSKVKMSGQTKEVFDRLTEDAMKLLDNGEYNVYSEKKETFQREAEGYEALEKAKLRLEGEPSTSFDMFGGDETEAEQTSTAADEAKNKLPQAQEPPVDMFGEDNKNNTQTDTNGASNSTGGEEQLDNSGYIFDETSGYYYNSSLGYYYDGRTGLFCNAATGKWLRFDEESNSYIEVAEEQKENCGTDGTNSNIGVAAEN